MQSNFLFVIVLGVFGQNQRQNETGLIETPEEMSISIWRPSWDLSYAENMTEFFTQVAQYSEYITLPKLDDLEPLRENLGMWYTLWNELTLPPSEAIRFSSASVPVHYVAIRYILCGDSYITMDTSDSEDGTTIENTRESDGNFTCDGRARLASFRLDQKYGVKSYKAFLSLRMCSR